MQTNYYMYSEGTMGGIFMDFFRFKILQMPSPKGLFSKAHFPQSRTSFKRGV